MKKILFFLLLFSYSLTNAQIGDGYDFAMNFGGAGSEVKNVVHYNGDTYFVANVMGRASFAGQEIDGGGYGSFPGVKIIYGKISNSGTQTLLKIIPTATFTELSPTGELYLTFVGSLNSTYDFGNGITDNNWGFRMVKYSNAGVALWKKDIATGATVQYGNAIPNPSVLGIQITPDGNCYMAFTANNAADNAPNSTHTMPARITKLNSTGDEVWHHEFYYSGSLTGTFNLPKQFVSNDGRVTFGLYSQSNKFYFDGQDISAQMSNYSLGTSAYSFIASLNQDGTKNWTLADEKWPVLLKGVDPQTGKVYIAYTTGNLTGTTYKSSRTPFNSLPNLFPVIAFSPTYQFSGVLILDASGTYQSYALGGLTGDNFDKLYFTNNNIFNFQTAVANTIVDKGGDYIFKDSKKYSVISIYDKSFNFQKAFKNPEVTSFYVSGDKISLSGGFTGNLKFGSTTLTQSFNDTDFATRFPSWASLKADMFIAQADIDNITTPPTANWLGVDNNWNNIANWSSGAIPISSTIVRFNSTTANMPTTGTSPVALKLSVDAGVTASVPTNLAIGNRLVINGTLQVNHTGMLVFNNFAAPVLEGTGTLSFNGSSSPSVISTSTGNKDLTVSTNENMNFTGTWKKLIFSGSSSIISTSDLELTSPTADAVTGASETNFIVGKLTRAISSSGTFSFPVSTASNAKPEPVTIITNNLAGTNKLSVSTGSSPGTPNVYFPSGTTSATLGTHFWTVTPDAAPTSGTYDISFNKNKFTNGVTDPDRYVVLKRIDSSNPWIFEGTKIASTQTGGTTNNNVVSNAIVTAGLTGLSKFSDFVIGINSVAVPNNTAVTASTWTGAVNTTWANAGNWSNGIPNSTVEATIPSGLTNYPLIYSTTDNARSLTIQSGITGLKLHGGLILSNGLTNNSTIEIAKLATMSDFKGYNGGISGSGKLVFTNSGQFTRIEGGVYNNDIEINVGNATVFYASGKFGGNFNVISGKVVSYFVSPTYLEQVNSSSTLTIAAPANLIGGEVYKNVNTTGTYTFPIGDDLQIRNSVVKYGEISITNNNIATSTVYKVKFDYGVTEAVSLSIGSDVYNTFINSGQWYINPTITSSTGTVDINLKTSGFTNGRASTSDYVLLRRNASSYNPATPWAIVSGATISESAGTISVSASGLAPFSSGTMFCIGLKATTTTWLGNTSTDWNTASNWSNGVPSSSVKAVIANASRYPSNAPTSGSAAAAIEVASGSTLTLPSTFYTPIGIINNGTINITGSGIFYGFGTGTSFSTISGTGKLVFDSSSPATFDSYYMNQTLNNNIEVNKTGGITLTRNTTFNGNVSLINGVVTMGSGQLFIMSNPSATLTTTAISYVNGDLRRTINSSGTYSFGVGNSTNYAPAVLSLNNIIGPATIQVSFSNAAVSGNPSLTIGGNTVNSVLAAGTWKITPSASMTGGSYDVILSAPLGSSTASSFYVIKREDNYSFYTWANYGTNQPSLVNAGVVTASATGITGFSQFGIGEGTVTLPVELVNFSAKANGNSVALSWETLSENNNEKFVIERADDSGVFDKIGELKGNGNSTKRIAYDFRDLSPFNGNNYYRLKQIDFNGTFKFSEIRNVNLSFNNSKVSVYPNPATEEIRLKNPENVKSITLLNTNGQVVLKERNSFQVIKLGNDLQNGLYIIQIEMKDGNINTSKIMINK